MFRLFFFFNDTATTEIYTLSLHDALPIYALKLEHDIGPLKIKISGCINACGHHHVGHIGILGVDKKGEEFYQITLGGAADDQAAIGEIVGRGLSTDKVVDAVEKLVDVYLDARSGETERFIDTYRRLGAEPFKEALYDAA